MHSYVTFTMYSTFNQHILLHQAPPPHPTNTLYIIEITLSVTTTCIVVLLDFKPVYKQVNENSSVVWNGIKRIERCSTVWSNCS